MLQTLCTAEPGVFVIFLLPFVLEEARDWEGHDFSRAKRSRKSGRALAPAVLLLAQVLLNGECRFNLREKQTPAAEAALTSARCGTTEVVPFPPLDEQSTRRHVSY